MAIDTEPRDRVPHDVYAPPQAPVADVGAQRRATEYFVVSSRKLWLLNIATFGLYGYYWRYKMWAAYRRWHRETLWPAARSIFWIFFAHSLNREIDRSLREAHIKHRWWPMAVATVFVIAGIVSGIVSGIVRLGDLPPGFAAISLAMLLPMTWMMVRTQRAANLACADAAGAGNARLTAANWIWLALGGILWALNAAGWVLIALGRA
jgi:hypothetical protein